MSFDQYYQDELAYLNEMGEAFSDAYPKLAPFLAQKGQDPDVERLLEGFAFMAGKIRQKLDDELPEITHTLHQLLWPDLLKPVPSLSILQFTAEENSVTGSKIIARGVEVDSRPVDGTSCRFRTCYDVDLHPLSIDSVKQEDKNNKSIIRINFKTVKGVSCDQLDFNKLRLFLYGDTQTSFGLYQYLFRYLDEIKITGFDKDKDVIALDKRAITQVGFSDKESLLEHQDCSFSGYRLLQEYYSLPHKFLFCDINELSNIKKFTGQTEFSIELYFGQQLHDFIRVNNDSFQLNCSPIINLFEIDADPIRQDQSKSEYRVRPANIKQRHFEVYSIQDVVGYAHGGKKRIEYQPFVSFKNRNQDKTKDYNFYQTRHKPSVVGSGSESYMSFVTSDDGNFDNEAITVSLDLKCTNRNLPEKLKIGDVCKQTGSSPEFATSRNIFPPTPTAAAPLHKDLQWQLISNMSLNYVSLTDIEALRTVLATYNFHAAHNRKAARSLQLKLQGLEKIVIEPATRLLKGLPLRGHKIELDVRSEKFGNEGEMYLFVTILNRYFALYASINTFTELVVNDLDRGEVYQWPVMIGQQQVI